MAGNQTQICPTPCQVLGELVLAADSGLRARVID